MGPLLAVLARVAAGSGRGAGIVAKGATKVAAGAGVAAADMAGKLSAKVFDFNEEKAKRSLPPSIQPALQSQPSFAEPEPATAPIQAVNNTISNSGSIDDEDSILKAMLSKLTSIESITGKILDLLAVSEQARVNNQEKNAIKKSSGMASFMPSMSMPQIPEASKNNMLLTILAAVGPFLVDKTMELMKGIGEKIDAVKEVYSTVTEAFSMFINDAIFGAKDMYEKVISFSTELIAYGGVLFDKAQLAVSDLIENIIKKGKEIGKAIMNLPIVKQIVEGFQAIFDWLDQIIPEPIKKAMGWAKETVSTTASKATEKIKSTAKGMMEGARNSNVLMNVFDNAFGGAAYDPNAPTIPNDAKKVSSRAATTEIPVEGRALLDTIAMKESDGDYGVIVGGKKFSDFSKHPEQVGYTYANGAVSTAAGRYQITKTTNKALEERYPELKGFTPEIQDKKAWILAQERYKRETGKDLAEELKTGNVQEIGRSLSKEWTSLAGGIQATHSDSGFVKSYNESLMGQKANELSNMSNKIAEEQNKKPVINVQMPPQAPNMGSASKAGEGSTSFIPSPDAGFDPTLNVLKSSPMFMMG